MPNSKSDRTLGKSNNKAVSSIESSSIGGSNSTAYNTTVALSIKKVINKIFYNDRDMYVFLSALFVISLAFFMVFIYISFNISRGYTMEHGNNAFMSFIASYDVGIWLLFLAIMFLKWHDNLNVYYFVVIAAVVTAILTYITKEIISLPRPPGALMYETGYGYPSGHSARAVSSIMFLFFAYRENVLFADKQQKKNKVYFTLFFIVAIAFGILISYDRIYLGVHYLFDVIGGHFFGLTCASALYALYMKYEKLMMKILKKMHFPVSERP